MLLIFIISTVLNPSIVRLKYSGGDWYNDPGIIPNLAAEINKRTPVKINESEMILSLDDNEIFSHPFLFLTGHGKIELSEIERENLSKYLWNGGFVYADDDYGMDEHFNRLIKETFPHHQLVRIPPDHEIFTIFYKLEEGLPKIHEHYRGSPESYGLFLNGRMALFYTYNSNISDGWNDPSVYNDPENLREKALRMGINIYLYALTH